MNTNQLSNSVSNRLHMLRWISALAVVVGHIEMVVSWRTGHSIWPWAYHMAHMAVMVFFVLSGFIIAHVVNRTPVLTDYMLERATRIYTVLIPAVLLTILLDTFGKQYSLDFYNLYTPRDNYLVRLLVNLFGLQGWQGYRVQFGTNSPLWSIGYEVFFYVIFGLINFKILKSQKPHLSTLKWLLAVLLLMALVGIEMVSYFLIWLMGTMMYHIRDRIRLSRAFVIITVSICSYALIEIEPGYTQDFVFSLGLCVLFVLADGRVYGAKFNEFMANFSYSLYAIHLPVLFLIYASLWRAAYSPQYFAFASIAAALSVAYCFSIPFEKKRYGCRALLKNVLSRISSGRRL